MSLPDVELVAITRLKAQLGSSYDIATTLGTDRPAITVSAAGGLPLIERVLDSPRLAITGWATTRLGALQACTAALDALTTTAVWSDGGWIASGVHVTRCFTVMRPDYALDPVAEIPRYDATVALVCRIT